jgi:hypothetical protein
VIGDPSMLRLIRKAAALARIFPTLDLSIEEKAGKVIQEASSFFSLYRFMINKKKIIRLMVLYGRLLGQRFYIIANCILIVQTQ